MRVSSIRIVLFHYEFVVIGLNDIAFTNVERTSIDLSRKEVDQNSFGMVS